MKAMIAKTWPYVLIALAVIALAGCAATGPGGAAAGGLAGGALAVLLTLVGAAAGGAAVSGCTNVAGRACELDADGDGTCADEDCNDSDPNVFPGADESRCEDGVDSDCDGVDAAPGDPTRCPPVSMNTCTDVDGDGYGEGFCPGPDCDDGNASIHPGAADDPCDGIDSDCNGSEPTCNPIPDDLCCDHVDSDGDGTDGPAGASCNCCYDDDGDGFGVGFCPEQDCNDADASIHPGAPDDPCDTVDSDCGTGPEVTCNPLPEDICCDHIDGDGDGRDDPRGLACNCCYDDDGDGVGVGGCGTVQDCNDADAGMFPGNVQESDPAAPLSWEFCSDGKDNDCDGLRDYEDPQCPIINGMLDETPASDDEEGAPAWSGPSDDDDGGETRSA